MKTIFISIFDGDTERVILRTAVFRVLKESGHKIVLLVRGKERVDHYRKEYGSDQVVVELLPPANSFLEVVWYYIGWNSIPTRAVEVRRIREHWNHGKFLVFFAGWFAGLLSHMRIWRELLRSTYFVIGEDYAKELFSKYKPDLLFAANMFSPEDTRLLRMAKKLKVRSVTIAKSWDVLTTKAFTRVKADHIVVYNELNRKEAVMFGDYKPEQITVTGFPQFDIYTEKNIYLSREEFCKRVGLDPSRRTILYGLPGDWKSPDTRAILVELDKRIGANAFAKPIQILARFHPKYPDSSQGLESPHIIFDRPGTYFSKGGEFGIDASASTYKWTFRDDDIIHLANSLYHSDIVINVDSTLTLDAAALDTPSILIGYDGDRVLPYHRSIAFIYERNHYQNVLKTGSAPVVKSHEELEQEINLFLSDPLYRREGLNKLKSGLVYKIDGASGKRMGEAILTQLQQ